MLLLVPRVEAFALPYLSKRATLKAPRRCKYINTHQCTTRKKAHDGITCA